VKLQETNITYTSKSKTRYYKGLIAPPLIYYDISRLPWSFWARSQELFFCHSEWAQRVEEKKKAVPEDTASYYKLYKSYEHVCFKPYS